MFEINFFYEKMSHETNLLMKIVSERYDTEVKNDNRLNMFTFTLNESQMKHFLDIHFISENMTMKKLKNQ